MSEQKLYRGFAAMSKSTQRRLASMGGKTAHAKGAARTWDKDQAAAAGRKGGAISAAKRKAEKAARLAAVVRSIAS